MLRDYLKCLFGQDYEYSKPAESYPFAPRFPRIVAPIPKRACPGEPRVAPAVGHTQTGETYRVRPGVLGVASWGLVEMEQRPDHRLA